MKSTAIPNMFMGYICLSHKHVLHNSRENEMHILRMMNCTNIGKCWYTIAESGSLWPSSLSLPSSISLFHWQIISVNSKNEEHFIHCFIFLFSVTKNYIESHSVRSSILFFSAYRLLCCKTCVHSLSSYLIFIPLHFSTRLSLFFCVVVSHVWYNSFSSHSFLHSLGLDWMNELVIVRSSSLQTAMNRAIFHSEQRKNNNNTVGKSMHEKKTV